VWDNYERGQRPRILYIQQLPERNDGQYISATFKYPTLVTVKLEFAI